MYNYYNYDTQSLPPFSFFLPPYLFFQQDVHVCERDVDSLIATLTQAADYSHQVHAPYTRILCLLSKGAVSC